MHKSLCQQAAKTLVGIKVRTNNAAEADPMTGKIFPCVQDYFHKGRAEQIAHRSKPGTTYCVYTDYEAEHCDPASCNYHGDYSYFIGEEVDSVGQLPESYVSITLPAQSYAKLTNGPASMPDVVRKPWQAIWNMSPEELGGKRSFGADYEVYDERATDHDNIVLDIFIGID